MPSTRPPQSATRLALLAMFLLLAAPLFSQGLASAAPTPAWLSELACGDGAHDQPHDQPLCGYCTLLLSSPALTGALAGLDGAAIFVAIVPVTTLSTVPGEPVIPHDAPPRAPPYAQV